VISTGKVSSPKQRHLVLVVEQGERGAPVRDLDEPRAEEDGRHVQAQRQQHHGLEAIDQAGEDEGAQDQVSHGVFFKV
jgi:hypothetical protein